MVAVAACFCCECVRRLLPLPGDVDDDSDENDDCDVDGVEWTVDASEASSDDESPLDDDDDDEEAVEAGERTRMRLALAFLRCFVFLSR